MNLNRATLLGNVTRDPEGKTTPNGQNVATFGVATNQKWKDASGNAQERVEFHNIVAWGKLADVCTGYIRKGMKLYVEGRIQTRQWEAQDGTKKNRTEIILENLIMLDRKPGTTTASVAANAQDVEGVKDRMASVPAPTGTNTVNGEEQDISLDSIPF